MATRPDGALFDSDEPLAIIVEAVLRSAWALILAIVGILVSVVRHPVLTMVAAAVAVVAKQAGLWFALSAVFGLVATGVCWRLASPSSFTVYGRPRLVELLVTPWYRLRWPRVASRTGLVAYDHDVSQRDSSAPRAPLLRRVRVSRTGVRRLLLRLPHGITPAMVAEKADGIAHAMRCQDARIVEHRPGHVWLELHRQDALPKSSDRSNRRRMLTWPRFPSGGMKTGHDGSCDSWAPTCWLPAPPDRERDRSCGRCSTASLLR